MYREEEVEVGTCKATDTVPSPNLIVEFHTSRSPIGKFHKTRQTIKNSCMEADVPPFVRVNDLEGKEGCNAALQDIHSGFLAYSLCTR